MGNIIKTNEKRESLLKLIEGWGCARSVFTRDYWNVCYYKLYRWCTW